MKNALKLIVVAVLGYVGYEAYQAYKRHRTTSEGPTGPRQTHERAQRALREKEAANGPVVTGGHGGTTTYTADHDGEAVATVVGRGVVKPS